MTTKIGLQHQPTQELIKKIVNSTITGNIPYEELLKQLEHLDIEWQLTEEGTLWIKYWQIGAENFAPAEKIAELRTKGKITSEVDAMEWVSKHLSELRNRYSGKWIAVVNEEVIAASEDLSILLKQINTEGIEKPFVTQIPAQSITWTMAYAYKRL